MHDPNRKVDKLKQLKKKLLLFKLNIFIFQFYSLISISFAIYKKKTLKKVYIFFTFLLKKPIQPAVNAC